MSSETDQMLYRPLKDGKQYDKLIPGSTCERVDLGEGMTDYTVTQMAEWIREYAHQMAKVAPLMKQRLLQQTCSKIHEFAYWHFTYKADLEEQFLRSPACAWYSRAEGLDCKSYSIIASCILVNLDITHYIRRVRQPGWYPELWTHVYIIVPQDQVKGDLNKGYYVIDGTVPTDDEPPYIEKSDTIMMKHTGLAGAHGLGFGLADVKNLFSGNLSLKSLSCIGGSYDATDLDITMRALVQWYETAIAAINSGIQANSNTVMTLVNNLLLDNAAIKDHSLYTSTKDWSSDCSKKATAAYRDLGIYYNDIITKAFLAWLESYFIVGYTTVTIPNNKFVAEIRVPANQGSVGQGFRKDNFMRDIQAKKVNTLVLKPGIISIKAFAITPYVSKPENYSGGIDPLQVLSGLTTIIATFSSGNNGGTTTNNGGVITIPDTTIDPSTGIVNTGAAKTSQAGAGTIVGIILLCAGLGYAFVSTPDKPARSTATKKPARKSSTKKTIV